MAFANGQTSVGDAGIPIWIMLLCSATMGIGTSVGGERIIKSVGQSMLSSRSIRASPPTSRRREPCLPPLPASPCPPHTSRPAPSWASVPSSASRPSTSESSRT
ncbi:MAG: inorganic phosphate transporter [Collinsella sp.]